MTMMARQQRSRPPTTDATTIAAISPPDNPELLEEEDESSSGVVDAVDGVGVAVADTDAEVVLLLEGSTVSLAMQIPDTQTPTTSNAFGRVHGVRSTSSWSTHPWNSRDSRGLHTLRTQGLEYLGHALSFKVIGSHCSVNSLYA